MCTVDHDRSVCVLNSQPPAQCPGSGPGPAVPPPRS